MDAVNQLAQPQTAERDVKVAERPQQKASPFAFSEGKCWCRLPLSPHERECRVGASGGGGAGAQKSFAFLRRKNEVFPTLCRFDDAAYAACAYLSALDAGTPNNRLENRAFAFSEGKCCPPHHRLRLPRRRPRVYGSGPTYWGLRWSRPTGGASPATTPTSSIPSNKSSRCSTGEAALAGRALREDVPESPGARAGRSGLQVGSQEPRQGLHLLRQRSIERLTRWPTTTG